ncbi:MAG: pyruvate kinase [Chloroflexi bacterium]|nr:pyruvate kinase [Chloroflexota bacterium]
MPFQRRNVKIVATVGPASQDETTLRALIQAGVDVIRLNFSHGTHEEHAEIIARVRRISHRVGKAVAILQDLQGPKIRVGKLPKEPLVLTAGETVILYPEGKPAPDKPVKSIPVDFPELPRVARPNGHILLDDGHLELVVLSIQQHLVEAKVLLGGQLSSHKGINFPGVPLDIPGFTEKDEEDLAFGLRQGVDSVAVSFVRSAADIGRVRQAIAQMAPDRVDTPIIAKLERPEALENLHEIIHAADGVMVARGDLGVELPPQKVPIAQKEIIAMANRHAKLVITATQMLDSMIHAPRPTRAEASDVANAVFDGTDAVMLSGETAAGEYPIEAVRMMDAIVREAESHFDLWGHYEDIEESTTRDDARSLTRAARALAHDRDVAAIAVFTQTGRTAMLMSKARPRVPIFAFTPEERTYRRLSMYWGVVPQQVPFANTVETMIHHVEAALRASTPIETGQQVVLISGFPVGAMRPPNFALLHTVGETA